MKANKGAVPKTAPIYALHTFNAFDSLTVSLIIT
jgi:hypothetical protein